MKKTLIEFVPKEELHPAFGHAAMATRRIRLRRDLPGLAKVFVVAHELRHLDQDMGRSWISREVEANLYGLLACPLGGLVVMIMSLHKDRLRMYWRRFKERR